MLGYEITETEPRMQVREYVGTAPRKGRVGALRLTGGRLISDNAAGLSDFENWLGTPIGFVTAFAEDGNAAGTWLQALAVTQSQAAAFTPLNRMIHWGMPLIMGTAGNGLVETLRGDHDETIREMFRVMKAARPNDPLIFVRLGWEFNFWFAYPWGRAILSPAQYKALFRHIVAVAWGIDGAFIFDWTPNVCVDGADGKIVDPTPYDPGPEWAEIVGCDAYIRHNEEVSKGRTPYQAITRVWEGYGGIEWLYDFAEKTNRPFLIAETGIVGSGGGDNGATGDLYAAHWNRLYDFVRTKNVVLHGLWNKATPYNCRLSNSQYPIGSAAYKNAFDKVVKPWTAALQWGVDFVEDVDTTNAANVTVSGGLVTAVADIRGGKSFARVGTSGLTYSATARLGKPGIINELSGAVGVGAMVMADVANRPAIGRAHTTIIAQYIDPAAQNFTYMTADADGGAKSRAIGQNGGNIRLQGSPGVYAVAQAVRGVDSVVVMTWKDAYAPTTSAKATVQGSVNGVLLWSDEVAIEMENFTLTRSILFGIGAAADAVNNRIPGVFKERITVMRYISQEVAEMAAAAYMHKWGNADALPVGSKYRLTPPTYGGVLS